MLKQLTDAMRFVEENLQSEIDFEEVSKIACVTKDSFMRFFSYMTGMTLKEYVRRRRLTLAAYDVQAGKEKIVDIAVKYGYESPDAFRRAFTLQHGITPMTLRRHGGTISPYPPVSFHIMIKGAEKMNCKWKWFRRSMCTACQENLAHVRQSDLKQNTICGHRIWILYRGKFVKDLMEYGTEFGTRGGMQSRGKKKT